MRRMLPFAALIVFAPLLAAQSSSAPANFTIERGQGCPVAMSAQRRAPFTMEETGKSQTQPSHGYLFLRFAPDSAKKARGIVAATIILHGTGNAPRVEPATTAHSADLTESFHLGNGNSVLSDSQVSPTTVANVRWVSIAELRYKDGTTWHPSGKAFCRITPDGFELANASPAK